MVLICINWMVIICINWMVIICINWMVTYGANLYLDKMVIICMYDFLMDGKPYGTNSLKDRMVLLGCY